MAEDQLGNRIDEILRIAGSLFEKSKTHDQHFEAISHKVGLIDKRFDIIDERLEIQGAQLHIIDGRLSEVSSKVIEIEKRLAVVEAKLSLMESKLTSLEDEARQIRLEMNELNERAEIAIGDRKQIDQLEIRVFQLEEKLSA